MSTNSLNGVLGQAAHFAGDYLFRDTALPNDGTLDSDEHTLGNTLGKLQLTGKIDQQLSLTGTDALTIVLQYQDGSEWKTLHTLVSVSGSTTVHAGEIFAFVPPPSNTRRIYRIQVTTNFDASEVKLTAAIEILPIS